jgi:hypothetical protein
MTTTIDNHSIIFISFIKKIIDWKHFACSIGDMESGLH